MVIGGDGVLVILNSIKKFHIIMAMTVTLLCQWNLSNAQSQQEITLFNGELGKTWLELAWAGGDFQKFAHFENKELIVDVPQGNSWGKTGIRSAGTVFQFPEHDTDKAVQLKFSIDSERTTGFVYAIIPDNWDANKEWRSHIIRLQVNKEDNGETATASLWIEKKKLMSGSFPMEQLSEIAINIQSDKVVLVRDRNHNIILQGKITSNTNLYRYGYKVSAMTYAKEENSAVKLALKSIEMHQINFQKEDDLSLVSTKTGKTILFDGELFGHNWQQYVKAKTEFDTVAKLENGALRVDVPAEASYANVGIESTQPLIWLDQFGKATQRELEFDFIPELTSGFAIALSLKKQNFILKWFKNHESDSGTVQIYLSDNMQLINTYHSTYKPVWEQQTSSFAPTQVKLLITPDGITVSSDSFTAHTQQWDRLYEHAGYDVRVFSFPEMPNKPVQMALKKITQKNKVLQSTKKPRLKQGVEALPVNVFFNGTQHESWDITPWNLPEGSEIVCDYNQYGFSAKDTDKKSPSSICGVNHKDQIIVLDERSERADYQVSVYFDPEKTKNFSIIWSHQQNRRNWDYCELTLLQTENSENQLFLKCSGELRRTISQEWLDDLWNGRINLVFSKNYILAEFDNGPAIFLDSKPWRRQYLYIMAPHYRYRSTAEQMQLLKVTGQWQTKEPIDNVDRWYYIDKADFDPEKFINDLANDLPYPHAKISGGDTDEN